MSQRKRRTPAGELVKARKGMAAAFDVLAALLGADNARQILPRELDPAVATFGAGIGAQGVAEASRNLAARRDQPPPFSLLAPHVEAATGSTVPSGASEEILTSGMFAELQGETVWSFDIPPNARRIGLRVSETGRLADVRSILIDGVEMLAVAAMPTGALYAIPRVPCAKLIEVTLRGQFREPVGVCWFARKDQP